jgi:hypothetical protein
VEQSDKRSLFDCDRTRVRGRAELALRLRLRRPRIAPGSPSFRVLTRFVFFWVRFLGAENHTREVDPVSVVRTTYRASIRPRQPSCGERREGVRNLR